MAQLLIRRLDDEAKKRLKARAERNARSLEAEAREILKEAAEKEGKQTRSTPGFGTRIATKFKGIGFTRTELEKFNRAVEKARKERARFVKFEP